MRSNEYREGKAAVAFARNIQELDATLNRSAAAGAAAIKAPTCPPGSQFDPGPGFAAGHPSHRFQTQSLAVSRTSPEVR
ncbi:MAG: hypothetical protein J0H49_09675 [Acidobacteria bacterium]|nr:hypothetical protein [Acidobacteriota bacterium]